VGAAVESVDPDLLELLQLFGESARGVDHGRLRSRFRHATAHVDEEERVVRGSDLRVEDGLLALGLGNRALVLGDTEVLGLQPTDGLAVALIHGEVDRDVPGPPRGGPDRLEVEATPLAPRQAEQRDEGDNERAEKGVEAFAGDHPYIERKS